MDDVKWVCGWLAASNGERFGDVSSWKLGTDSKNTSEEKGGNRNNTRTDEDIRKKRAKLQIVQQEEQIKIMYKMVAARCYHTIWAIAGMTAMLRTTTVHKSLEAILFYQHFIQR